MPSLLLTLVAVAAIAPGYPLVERATLSRFQVEPHGSRSLLQHSSVAADTLTSLKFSVLKPPVPRVRRAPSPRLQIEPARSRPWIAQSAAMAGASAFLGPLCDGCHSRHNVLHYADPFILRAPGGAALLETCWWVPCLFAVAGIILGATHPILDNVATEQGLALPRSAPGWPSTLLVISCFVACYELSGVLAQAAATADHEFSLIERLGSLDGPLALCAAAIFFLFEASPGGLFMAALTALIGPLVEITLINFTGAYSYSSTDWLGIPAWIPWVYAAGGPAVGALGRQVMFELEFAGAGEDKTAA